MNAFQPTPHTHIRLEGRKNSGGCFALARTRRKKLQRKEKIHCMGRGFHT